MVGLICFFVTIGTFKNVALKYDNPIGLWITYLIYPAVCVVIYTVSQLILVIRTLDDRWAIGHIVSGAASSFVNLCAELTFCACVAIRPRILRNRCCLVACILQHHLRIGITLSGRCLLLPTLHAFQCHDGLQILGL